MKLTNEQLKQNAQALANLHGIPLKVAVQLVSEYYEQGFKDGVKCTT